MTTPSPAQPVSGKAVTYRSKGGTEVIEIIEREVRVPARNEVRIAVAAAAVNPTDILLRDPGYPNQNFPVVPGMDAAGIVDAVGPGVSRLSLGQKVMAAVVPSRPDGGAQASHIIVPEASVVAIPEGVSLAEAATLPMNGLTAFYALELAALQVGQWLAVSGGAGLLASYAIAVAKRQGLKVIADAKPDEMAKVQRYGADLVIERGPDFADAIRAHLPSGADALLDTAVMGEQAFGALRDGGAYIPVRGWSGNGSPRGIEIRPMFVFHVLDRIDWLEQLREMVIQGAIRPQVEGQYTPESIGEAQSRLAAGGIRGRLVITF